VQVADHQKGNILHENTRLLFPTLSRRGLLRFAHLTSADLSVLRHRPRGGGRVRSRPGSNAGRLVLGDRSGRFAVSDRRRKRPGRPAESGHSSADGGKACRAPAWGEAACA
jgi:hypothetical protein